MSEPQIWAALGILAAALAATITISTQLMMKTFAAKVEAVGHQISGLRTEMVLRFEHVDERMDRLEKRVDGIDTDVQTLTRRVLGD